MGKRDMGLRQGSCTGFPVLLAVFSVESEYTDYSKIVNSDEKPPFMAIYYSW